MCQPVTDLYHRVAHITVGQLADIMLGICRFECKSDGNYLDIMHISLEKTDEDPEESAYTGPVSTHFISELCNLFLTRTCIKSVTKSLQSFANVLQAYCQPTVRFLQHLWRVLQCATSVANSALQAACRHSNLLQSVCLPPVQCLYALRAMHV